MFEKTNPSAAKVDKIYRDHSGFIWRVARTRGVPLTNIPDVLQDTFMTVLRRLPTYQEMGSLKGWLYSIADGHIRQFFRTEGRRERRLELFARTHTSYSDLNEIDEHLERSEATKLVQLFLNALPEDLREVFLLRRVEGLSGLEVAHLLQLNINTLYSRDATAWRRFQDFISPAPTSKGQAHE